MGKKRTEISTIPLEQTDGFLGTLLPAETNFYVQE